MGLYCDFDSPLFEVHAIWQMTSFARIMNFEIAGVTTPSLTLIQRGFMQSQAHDRGPAFYVLVCEIVGERIL